VNAPHETTASSRRSVVLLLSLVAVIAVAVIVGFRSSARGAARVATTTSMPARLSDQEFWRLSVDSSEPGGTFPRENLTSNELLFQEVIPALIKRTRPGDVYLGVGPEQNFTYISAVRPAMAIIFDIRHDNLLLQLMYKAIFELSADRADFVSMLFSKPRPSGIGPQSTAVELFAAFDRSPGDNALYQRNLRAIEANLTKAHKLPLTPADLAGLESTYDAFHFRGFAVRFSPTYEELMTATDNCGSAGRARCDGAAGGAGGVGRSYLATEANFNVMKSLESKNLVVPVVGDFGGPKAIRAVGRYLKAHGATVSAFYLSNVEQYLYQDGKEGTFCRNVASLPIDETSTFIRSSNRGRFGTVGGFGGFGGGFVSSLGDIATEVKSCR